MKCVPVYRKVFSRIAESNVADYSFEKQQFTQKSSKFLHCASKQRAARLIWECSKRPKIQGVLQINSYQSSALCWNYAVTYTVPLR